MFNLKDFSRLNALRCKRWHPMQDWSLNDWFVAVGGELGEAMNVSKKLRRIETGAFGNDTHETAGVLLTKLEGELADAFIYLDLVATHANIDLGAAVRRKFNQKSEELNFPERILHDGTCAILEPNLRMHMHIERE